MKIPYPENPEHIDNMRSVALLEAQGWEGPDASLEISLHEYDCAWLELEEEHALLFIYKIHTASDDAKSLFGRTRVDSYTDLYADYDWCDWQGLFACNGTTKEVWDDAPLCRKLNDLLNYLGYENVFGGGGGAQFTIN